MSPAHETTVTILPDLSSRVAPGRAALVIIDMQKDFLTPGYGAERAGRDLTAGRAIIPNIERLLAGARKAGITIAHVGFRTLPDNLSDSGPWLAQRRRSTYSSDTLCMDATEGAAFIDELAPRTGELVFHKFRYSAFAGTALDMVLKGQGIETVILTGVSTNACVESTLRYALELNYYVVVPHDGVASWSRHLHEATLENVNHRFGLTPAIDEILSIWTPTTSKGGEPT